MAMSTVGFAALALAAGLWALTRFKVHPKRKDPSSQATRGAPSVQLPASAEVSDDEEEEDDLWDHIASILKSRTRAGAQTQANTLDDEEVWRIIKQIVTARKNSHRKFLTPDKASTLSVKELRQWFESQSARREQSGGGNSTLKSAHENSFEDRDSKGILIGGAKAPSEQESTRSTTSQFAKSKIQSIEPEGNSVSAQKGSERQGVLQSAEASIESPQVSRKIVRRQKSPPSELRDLIKSDHPPVAAHGPLEASPGVEKSGVSKIVQREQSRPKISDELLVLEEPEASEKGNPEPSKKVNKIVKRRKSSSPPDRFSDKSVSPVLLEASGDGSAQDVKQNGGLALGNGVQKGGSDYQGPPGGEDRVVVYMTSVRAVRKTFEECNTVRHIFHGFSVAVDERDISIHLPYRQELRDLMGGRLVAVPQVFIRGRHIGGLHEVQYLTDEKKMLELLQGMPRIKVTEECEGCGGGKFLPCIDCRGSRKIVEGDKVDICPSCNEYGLIRCPMCA